MNRKLAIAIMIISFLLIAGCGDKECESKNDCTPKGSCYIVSCVKGLCQQNVKPGCSCGDKFCGAGENPCNCAEDCKPPCTGDVDDYLTQKCDDLEECVTTIKKGVQKIEKVDDTIEVKDMNRVVMELLGIYTYKKPFNLASSLFDVKLKISKKQDEIGNVIIKNIKLISHTGVYNANTKTWTSDQAKTVAEREYERVLWGGSTEFSESFPLILDEDLNGTLKKNLWFAVEVEFTTTDRLGNKKTTNFEYEKELEFVFVKPSEERACPLRAEWDDGNPCTTEKCSELTDFFVERDMKKSCKGNYVCETGENSCNAPLDCGVCEGDIGSYLEDVCYNLQCKSKLKQGVDVETVSIPDTRAMGETTFLVRTTFNKPFNIKKDKFSISYEAQKLGTVEGFTITTIQIIDKGTTQNLISDQKVDKSFPVVGTTQNIVVNVLSQLSTSIKGEETKKPSLKVFYKYTKPAIGAGVPMETIASYEQALGDVVFINPEVEI